MDLTCFLQHLLMFLALTLFSREISKKTMKFIL